MQVLGTCLGFAWMCPWHMLVHHHMQMHIHIGTCTRNHTHIHIHIHRHMHTHAQAYTSTCTCKYIYTYTYRDTKPGHRKPGHRPGDRDTGATQNLAGRQDTTGTPHKTTRHQDARPGHLDARPRHWDSSTSPDVAGNQDTWTPVRDTRTRDHDTGT